MLGLGALAILVVGVLSWVKVQDGNGGWFAYAPLSGATYFSDRTVTVADLCLGHVPCMIGLLMLACLAVSQRPPRSVVVTACVFVAGLVPGGARSKKCAGTGTAGVRLCSGK